MSALGKNIINKIHNSSVVISSMKTNIDQTAERWADRCKALPKGDRLTKDELKKVMLAEVALLEYETERLRDLAATHVTEKSQDLEKREVILSAQNFLRETITAIRDRIVDLGGESARRMYGIPKSIPTRRDELKTVCEEVLRQFDENPKSFEDRFVGKLTTKQLSIPLQKATEAYAKAHDALQLDVRETEDALSKRVEQDELWEQTYRAISYRMMGAFELSGMPDYSNRLRPTARRQTGEDQITPAPTTPPTENPTNTDAPTS